MTKKLIYILFLIPLMSFGQLETEYAFPGAEGYGRFATVGQPARTVYVVGNLSNSGTGSLRDALSASNRDIVFEVAGEIPLLTTIDTAVDNIVIHGQTAFRNGGGGITLRLNSTTTGNSLLRFTGDHIVIRHIRARRGPGVPTGECCGDNISFFKVGNVVLDHISVSWSTDENVEFVASTDVTVQHSIMGEGLYLSTHNYSADSGNGSYQNGHSKGSLVARYVADGTMSNNITFYRNYYPNNEDRNGRFATNGTVEFVNNLSLNGRQNPFGTFDPVDAVLNVNVVKNLALEGLDSKSNYYPIQIDNTDGFGRIYTLGNIGATRLIDTDPEWNAVGKNTVQAASGTYQSVSAHSTPMESQFTSLPDALDLDDTEHTATLGAYLSRDAVDTRLINELGGTSSSAKLLSNHPNYDAGAGSNPSVTTYYDLKNDITEAGGYPTIASMSSVPTDNDSDGVADAFETEKGFTDPNGVTAVWDGITNTAGYTNFQWYMLHLAGDLAPQIVAIPIRRAESKFLNTYLIAQ